jgi:hypothetical protein
MACEDPSPIEAAEVALFWGAINTGMRTQMADARETALRVLAGAQITAQAVLDADGVRLGTVTWSPPTEGSPVVTDELALLRWVKRNRPQEVMIREEVREAFVKWLIADAKANPEKVPIDKATGEVVPGITVIPAEAVGKLRVTPTAEGRARIRELLQRGENLRALTAPTERAPDAS